MNTDASSVAAANRRSYFWGHGMRRAQLLISGPSGGTGYLTLNCSMLDPFGISIESEKFYSVASTWSEMKEVARAWAAAHAIPQSMLDWIDSCRKYEESRAAFARAW